MNNEVKILPFKITLKKDGIPKFDKRSSPGIITQRSCPYYGARWILAPIKNTRHMFMLLLVVLFMDRL